jgi:nitric oxide reductase NorD protein
MTDPHAPCDGELPARTNDPGQPSRTDRLTLLASAICGYPITLAEGSELCTDGRRIFLDESERSGIDGLAVQAAVLALGTFQAGAVARLATRPKSRRRYLLLESRRAAQELATVLPPRTVRRILDAYDGPAPRDSHASLDLALSRDRTIPDAPDWMGVIKPSKLLLANPTSGGRPPTPSDMAGTAEQDDLPEADDDAEESRLQKLLQAPGGLRNPLTTYLQKLLGTARSPGGDSAGGGDEMPVAGHRAASGRSAAGQVIDDSLVPEGLLVEAAPTGRFYPEWDCHARRYRVDWCTVTDYDPHVEEGERFEAPPNLILRRNLARIGVGLERHRRQPDGDVIDLNALINRRVDRRSGFDDGDHRVYERKLRTSHDLGVLVLLDATGSTGESEEGKRIFDEQRLVVAELTAAFDALGARVAAYAFQSWGRNNVQFSRIKGYNDRYDSGVQHRLGALSPGGFTRLGAAIRHGSFVARANSGALTNLLVVVGDGLPYDDGYEHRYAEKDCRRALSEAVETGVACACLSVRSATDLTTLQRVWGSVPFEALQDPDDLAHSVSSLFPRALKAAAASRRKIGD